MPSLMQSLVDFIREQYRTKDAILLHEPRFLGNEKAYVSEAIDSTYVSSVGAFVDRFEVMVAEYTGAKRAIAAVNGTSALHVALRIAGVQPNDLVVTQPLTFVATCNAIAYCDAEPVFVDVDRHTLGLSPGAFQQFLEEHAERRDDGCIYKPNGRPIRACVPMHTFGHPADLQGIAAVCDAWGIALVEDAAESLGSFYRGRHTGTIGRLGVLSFNGNKIITTGGGGMILTNEEGQGKLAKHITTTAKRPHPYEFDHDQLGYNYRLPNLNAALGCAQMEQLEKFIDIKRGLAERYAAFLKGTEYEFIEEPAECRSNYWLNAVICPDRAARESLLSYTNGEKVMTRPIWKLMNRLPMYSHCPAGPLRNAEWLEERVVNLPSSVPLSD